MISEISRIICSSIKIKGIKINIYIEIFIIIFHNIQEINLSLHLVFFSILGYIRIIRLLIKMML